VLGLDGSHRMNLPGTLDGNWRWRFDWPMLPTDMARRLGEVAATSGRATIAKLG
jgi:4-alpha-glucanotransferase